MLYNDIIYIIECYIRSFGGGGSESKDAGYSFLLFLRVGGGC